MRVFCHPDKAQVLPELQKEVRNRRSVCCSYLLHMLSRLQVVNRQQTKFTTLAEFPKICDANGVKI